MLHSVKVNDAIFGVPGRVLATAFYSHVPLEGRADYEGLKRALSARMSPDGLEHIHGHIDIDKMAEGGYRELEDAAVGDYDLFLRDDNLFLKRDSMPRDLRAAIYGFLSDYPGLRRHISIEGVNDSKELHLRREDGIGYILKPTENGDYLAYTTHDQNGIPDVSPIAISPTKN